VLALLALLSSLQSSPAPAASAAPAAAATASPAPLPADPEQLARQQFAAFLSGNIDQRWYVQPLPQNAIEQVHTYLQSLGAIKNVALLKTADTAYGKAYAYKFTCANGAVLEQFVAKTGIIQGIYFRPAP
jgi:hypothetical protein